MPVEPIAKDTADKDPLIYSPFFETRVKFLNLCQVGCVTFPGFFVSFLNSSNKSTVPSVQKIDCMPVVVVAPPFTVPLFSFQNHHEQGNHFQFDYLRRAKHSSIMILHHVNNPTAPAFIHTCDSCNQDIVAGNRWECEQCHEYDLCDTCKSKDINPHMHPLKPVAVSGCWRVTMLFPAIPTV
jgi:hypothetical protein